jgi:hypothetical protein
MPAPASAAAAGVGLTYRIFENMTDVVLYGLRAILATVFAAAIIGKTRSKATFGDFARSLAEIFSPRWAGYAGIGFAAAELGCLILLIVPSASGYGFTASAIVLASFAIGVGLITRSNRTVECRCFGSAGTALSVRHFVRNVGLAGLAITGQLLTSSSSYNGRAQLGEVCVALAVGCAIGALVVAADDLAFLVTGDP